MPFCHITLTAQKREFGYNFKLPASLKTWGDHIRNRRCLLRLSRKEVAGRFGVSEFAVRNWENNIASPNRRYHSEIIKFLGYDPQVKIKEFYGEQIKDYLVKSGISRQELAEMIGVTPQTIHKWIHNMSSPPEKFLKRLL